jgi:acyl carrier protein
MRDVERCVDAEVIRSSLRRFIVSFFMPGDSPQALHDDDLLFEGGIVDSAGAIALIAFLEEEYGIQVPDQDLFPTNFATIEKIAGYVARRLTAG